MIATVLIVTALAVGGSYVLPMRFQRLPALACFAMLLVAAST